MANYDEISIVIGGIVLDLRGYIERGEEGDYYRPSVPGGFEIHRVLYSEVDITELLDVLGVDYERIQELADGEVNEIN